MKTRTLLWIGGGLAVLWWLSRRSSSSSSGSSGPTVSAFQPRLPLSPRADEYAVSGSGLRGDCLGKVL